MTAPSRHFRFNLRTLLLAMSIPGCVLAYHMNWMRGRHEVLRMATPITGCVEKMPSKDSWYLRLCGEQRTAYIFVGPQESESEFRRIQVLFPDAEVIRAGSPGVGYVRGWHR